MVDQKQYQDDYTVFRVKETDPKHKLWFVLDNHLVLPEYLAEFEYVSKSKVQSKVADFVDELGILDNEDDEFISSQNIQVYRDEIGSIYNTLADDVNNYQFENFEEYPNLELKSSDLDRSEVTSMKHTVVNFFKYCLSRSNYYELNPNLVRAGDEKLKVQEIINSGEGKFVNLSNCEIVELSELRLKPTILVILLSYNKISSVEPFSIYTQLQKLDLSHNEVS